MQKDRILNLLHLHFIVFIWGFTAILGKLITIDSLPLVWVRMGLATLFIAIYLLFAKFSIKISRKTFWWLLGGGVVVALHWVTFFLAINLPKCCYNSSPELSSFIFESHGGIAVFANCHS